MALTRCTNWSIFELITYITTILGIARGEYTFHNWKFHFPAGSSMGIFLAVALPIDLSHKNVFLAYNFEASYGLPFNVTEDEYPPTIQREGKSIDRKFVYDMIEAKIKTHGFPGKSCLLRTICEASTVTFENNGVLGDLLHILFTPSTSEKETDLSDKYLRAEKLGKEGNCTDYETDCPISFLFVAIAVPLDLDNYEVFISYNFEGNYVLPANETFSDYPPIVERSLEFGRRQLYEMLQQKFISHGYPGMECLQLAICEATEYSSEGTGVFADIVHLILTPSTSTSENLTVFEEAENYSRSYGHCRKYKKKCSFSILDVVSWIGNII